MGLFMFFLYKPKLWIEEDLEKKLQLINLIEIYLDNNKKISGLNGNIKFKINL